MIGIVIVVCAGGLATFFATNAFLPKPAQSGPLPAIIVMVISAVALLFFIR